MALDIVVVAPTETVWTDISILAGPDPILQFDAGIFSIYDGSTGATATVTNITLPTGWSVTTAGLSTIYINGMASPHTFYIPITDGYYGTTSTGTRYLELTYDSSSKTVTGTKVNTAPTDNPLLLANIPSGKGF